MTHLLIHKWVPLMPAALWSVSVLGHQTNPGQSYMTVSLALLCSNVSLEIGCTLCWHMQIKKSISESHHIPRRASHKLLALINEAGCPVVTLSLPWNWTQRHQQHSSRAAAVIKEALKPCWKWRQSNALCWDLPAGEVPVQWVVQASKSALQKSDPSGFSKTQFWEISPIQ